MSVDDVVFFGTADREHGRMDGRITSEVPSWYMNVHVDTLKAEHERMENEVKMGIIPNEVLPQVKADIKRMKERIDEVEGSLPNISKCKDDIAKMYGEIGEEISKSMFTEYEIKRKFASPHEEAKRMKDPIIEIDKKYAKVLNNMGLKTYNWKNSNKVKVSRDAASRAYKICGRLLGENTNVERLRKLGDVRSIRLD